jgi:DNA-binding transcriptional LysR family regulator
MCRILWSRSAQAITHWPRAVGVPLETLSKEIFVDLTPDRALRRLVDKVFAQHRIKRTTAFEVSDIQPARQFVANGLGVAVVPSAVARSSKNLGAAWRFASSEETAACHVGPWANCS